MELNPIRRREKSKGAARLHDFALFKQLVHFSILLLPCCVQVSFPVLYLLAHILILYSLGGGTASARRFAQERYATPRWKTRIYLTSSR